MTRIEVSLPDELAEQAQRAGLLSSSRIEDWLREQLRRQHVDELFSAMDRMHMSDETPAMSPEEVAEEIHLMRSERGANTR